MSKKLPEKNLMLEHYLQELIVLSSEIISVYEEIETLVNSRRPGMAAVFSFPENEGKYFFIQPEVFTKIASLQVYSSNIKKILFATKRTNNEALYKYDYRVKRASELQEIFDIDHIKEIRNSDVRNSLEHFEERLDLISLKLWDGSIHKKYDVIASNIILSNEGALAGNPYYLKSYVIDTSIYRNAEKESDINKIVSEAQYINKTARNKLGTNQITGSVIVIPPRN